MYGALAAMHGALATAHVLAPQWVIIPYFLWGAAEKEKLHQKEIQRLNLGAVTFAAATLGVHALQWDLLRRSAALTAGAIAGLTAAAPAFYYSRTSGHGLRPGPIFQGIFKDLGNLLHPGMKGAAYSILTLGILGAGASYIALPHESLTSVLPHATSPDCIMLWRSIGAGLLMLPTWTYNLKEASDAGVLHKPHFLDMNIGLATAGLTHLVVLGPWWLQGHAGPLMPYILGTWATAFAVGTWAALVKRPVQQPKPI
ncbi:g8407 [Coccomyxa elongata]